MTTQATDRVISNVFGTLGAVCWSTQLIPQIILNYRRHSATGLSSSFMLCWAVAGIPLGVYNIAQNFNIALQIQPQILTTLSLFTWAQCRYYQKKGKLPRVTFEVSILACVLGGIEFGLVYALRIALSKSVQWPLTLMAVLAALFLALGVSEQYIAIWKARSVEGISFLFCGIDAMGDVTSIISVCFEPKLRILGLVMYAVELLLWIGVFACGAYFRLLPWLRRRDSRSAQVTIPDVGEPGIALHDTASSTSVFQTASSTTNVASRRSNESSD